ncbi:hypothetical protein [Thermoactinomyces mirandus]|uniref:MarR family transcriptional regulator n=1 Tax=Thermoactinomyces mirandus TaxID=2756294 RepID=A0A7W2ASW5_9BACL|nr:hypothetical protein [Thermoactinomyces mirandus]MBA4602916.1 hypothetical protein [Thermoactinomyces mirandus]
MKPHSFQIPYSVADKLPPAERFVYYELSRLASTKTRTDNIFRVRIPPRGLIINHFRLAKEMDYPYTKVASAMEHLEKKGLIEIHPLKNKEFKSYYLVYLKKIYHEEKVPISPPEFSM